ncbi:uncharacterized protein LOC117341708 [Pecten maximus]|uniref:uncharacterized protein LOC117341708 n=1 Tax=Pecten maximus TaxID=6579 RepID=UPI0014587B66|nr:uncharacterized protein LOC117341708 [Pecten maximus]
MEGTRTKGEYTKVETELEVKVESPTPSSTEKYAPPTPKWLMFGVVLSVALILLQIISVVLTVDSINNLQNSARSHSTPVYNGYQQKAILSKIPCNRSALCSVVEDDTYTKLFTIFSGIKRQSLVRRTNKGMLPYQTWPNCKQFTLSLSNCSRNELSWTVDAYGRREVRNGTATIKENSTYGVHSIFTFENPHDNTKNISEIIHKIHIERGSHNGSEVVFERSVVFESETDIFKTSTIFDFVYLYAGDRVYPSVSDTSFLYNMSQANVWGIFPVI